MRGGDGAFFDLEFLFPDDAVGDVEDHFIQQEAGSSFAAYLADMRRGKDGAIEGLLRGRTLEQVGAEVAAMAKQMGLDVE